MRNSSWILRLAILVLLSSNVFAFLKLNRVAGQIPKLVDIQCTRITKAAEKVSYNVGCMEAIRTLRHLDNDEAVDPVWADWCTQSASAWSTMNLIKVR